MSAMDQKPTIVFVHGAWHTNEPFEEVQGILGKAGYGIKHVQLASSTPNGPYVQDIDDDVEIIQNTLNDVVETESDIVLVMHSYGGVVGSSAAKGFWRKVRKEKGKDGGIIHLVYLCAIVLPEGVSLKEGIGGETGPWVKIHGKNTYMTSHEDAREIFYNDLSDSEAQKWVSKLNRHATKSFEAPCTWAAWKHIPSTYLYCGKDNAVTPAGEEAMINQPGANFRVVRFEEASHSPFLSMPKETADVIRRAAGEKI